MKRPDRFFPFLAVLMLSACASLGLAPAKTFTAKLAYGYSQYTAVNNTIARALDSHDLSSRDAQNFRDTAEKARDILDGAKVASEAGDIANASDRLKLAIVVLDELAAYIDKGAKP